MINDELVTLCSAIRCLLKSRAAYSESSLSSVLLPLLLLLPISVLFEYFSSDKNDPKPFGFSSFDFMLSLESSLPLSLSLANFLLRSNSNSMSEYLCFCGLFSNVKSVSNDLLAQWDLPLLLSVENDENPLLFDFSKMNANLNVKTKIFD